MRKRLFAFPHSAAKRAVRVDWSPKSKQLIWYFWWAPTMWTMRRSHMNGTYDFRDGNGGYEIHRFGLCLTKDPSALVG